MNKIRFSQLVFFALALVLTACQGAGPETKDMFRPGDGIDGMHLTTGAQNAAPLWAFCSPAQYAGNTTTADCSVPVMQSLAIGHILMPGDDILAGRDWSEINWQLTIDGQLVDLESFGTYEFVLPSMSKNASPVREIFVSFTAWDVVLTNLRPGKHTIHGSAQVGAEHHSWVIHLTIEGTGVSSGTQNIS